MTVLNVSYDAKPVQQNYVPNARPFSLGAVVMTPGAQDAIADPEWIAPLLMRHISGDWGDCSVKDKIANDEATRDGDRVMSVYNLPNEKKVWVLTEANRRITTILLPVTD